jgi:hypothetical protein
MFQWIGNNLNWLIYVFVLIIPVVSSIGKWLQQEAAKKQAEAQRRRQLETQLRTGRSEPEQASQRPSESEAERQETFAERRRRQIEELKRRQEAAQRQREAAQQGRSQTSQPAPRTTAQQTTQQQAPRRQRADTDRPTVPTAGAAPQDVAEVSAEVESLAKKFERQTRAARTRKASPVKRVGVGPGLDRASLRRAIVMAEVLAPPVALRDDGQKAV